MFYCYPGDKKEIRANRTILSISKLDTTHNLVVNLVANTWNSLRFCPTCFQMAQCCWWNTFCTCSTSQYQVCIRKTECIVYTDIHKWKSGKVEQAHK